MSVPPGLYPTLKSACERGTTSQLALDNSLARGRLTTTEHTELSAILDAALNPPPPPAPQAPEPSEAAASDGDANPET